MSHPATEEETRNCIIARCGTCRKVIFGAVNRPEVMDKGAKREIAEMVAEGHSIEHVTAEFARNAEWGCECDDE